MESDLSYIRTTGMKLEQTGTELEKYEFNSSQNALIQDISNQMRLLSILVIAIALPLTIISFDWDSPFGDDWFNSVVTVTQIVVYLLVSRWTAKTASAFKLIVKTEGNDLENLMIALGEMRKLYKLQRRIFQITLILLLLRVVIDFGLARLTAGQ